MLVKDNDARWKIFNQTRNILNKGQLRIKVKEDAKNFIMNGKTELVEVESQTFNVISDDPYQYYFGDTYFYFVLERTF